MEIMRQETAETVEDKLRDQEEELRFLPISRKKYVDKDKVENSFKAKREVPLTGILGGHKNEKRKKKHSKKKESMFYKINKQQSPPFIIKTTQLWIRMMLQIN